METGTLTHMILGIGINVYAPREGFPEELRDIAGSVFPAQHRDAKNRIAAAFLNAFWRLYTAKDPLAYGEEYRSRSMVIGKPVTVESIERELSDVAGVRVICSFVDDIYKLADMLALQDDICVLRVKDYIKNPKPSGYRSLHMIVEVPIFLSKEKRYMRVEVQLRTIAMDFWASLEHKLRYKKDIPQEHAKQIAEQLVQCAQTVSETDQKMLSIRRQIEGHYPKVH